MKSSLRELVGRIGGRLRLPQRWLVITAVAAWAAALALVLSATWSPDMLRRGTAATAGTVAERDFEVDRDFRYVDEEATRLKREARERLVPPVFVLDEGATTAALQRFDRFVELTTTLLADGVSEERLWLKVQVDFPGVVARTHLRQLAARSDAARVLGSARVLLEDALEGGVVDTSGQDVQEAGAIELWRIREGRIQAEEIAVDRIVSIADPGRAMLGRALELARDEREQQLLLALLEAFAIENAFPDVQNTALHRARAAAEVEPVTERLVRGQVLVRRGDVITEAVAARIRALGEHATTVSANWVIACGLLLVCCLALAATLLAPVAPSPPPRRGQVILLAGLALMELGIGAVIVRLAPVPEWLPLGVLIPTGAVAMVTALLVSGQAAVVLVLATSLALLPLSGLSAGSFLFSFLGGAAATAAVLRAERRIDLVRAGVGLAIIDASLLVIVGLFASLDVRRMLALLGWGAANGLACGILALGILPIFEHLLNAATRFRLMELADLNAPIFRRMLSRAPGTYTHSIAVANLAESACEAIGANALLARVGAYYHDIGKIDQAEYFIENQRSLNKHDEMKPSLSAAVIKSHVRIGMEKARALALPQALVDLISQHHGRGLITYFYHRAVTQEAAPRVSRDDYSYPGVRPRSREAAVLMLADAVEAASRTLQRPSDSRLERFVQETFDAKLRSGELGDSGLTLRDLETVRRSFVQVLSGQFHSRIEYPKLSRRRPPG